MSSACKLSLPPVDDGDNHCHDDDDVDDDNVDGDEDHDDDHDDGDF